MLNGIIAKTNGRDKVIDFRDGLVLATPQDYAMLHGAGGKEHAPNSVIKIAICDYTSGTGEMSNTVFANITPEVCTQLFEVCKQNFGTMVMDSKFPMFVEQRATNRKMSKFADMVVEVLQRVLGVSTKAVEAADNGTAPGAAAIAKGINQRINKAIERVMSNDSHSDAPSMQMPRHMDFNYVQDRIHSQRKDAEGYAPVQRLTIYHQTYRKQGDLSNYPWTIKIINGEAKVIVQDTGATSFSSSTLRNTTEAFIQVSDADMFRMMDRVTHFITAWEITMAGQLIRDGEAQREKERKEYYDSLKAET